jgi:LPS export ABC transporter protein LptC
MIGRIFIALVVIAVIIGVLILGQGPGAALNRRTTEQPTEAPGYQARNAEVIETGENGRQAYTLNARLIRQRQNDSRVQLDGPRMSFLASDGTTWNIAARAGQIHPDGSIVDLFGDVTLEGKVQETPVTIGTSIISFDTRSQVARTEAPVTFDSNGGRLGATGLVANLKDGTVRLLSRVHGSFPPK